MREKLTPLATFFAWVVVVETVMTLLWGWSVSDGSFGKLAGLYGLTMLYSGAASFIGGLVGFLFGVPRTVAPPTPAESNDRTARPAISDRPVLPEQGLPITGPVVGEQLRVNTNLETLSDALTKGLIAIGLTQLNRLGTAVEYITAKLGPSFGPGITGGIFAVSILVYGLIGGFFFGYLLTRIYLTLVFAEADPRRLRGG